MTVPATARRAGPYNGNGSTTSFPFTFKTYATGDLLVIKTSTLGVESTLVLSSNYTVTLNVDQDTSPGGSITFPVSGTPLATGEKLTILSALDVEQTTDLLGGGAFNARVIEDTFDRTVIQIQQLDEQVGRAIKMPTSDGGGDVTLPSAADRAGRMLVFDEVTGAPEAGPSIAEAQALVAAINTANGFLAQVQDGVIERFVAGVDYTQNVTTVLTLDNTPLKPGSVKVFFSGVYQESTEYTITQPTYTTTLITFDAAIPAASVEICYEVGRSFAELDASVAAAAASASTLNEYLGTIATANMTFPLDLGQITDPVLYNQFDLGAL